MDPREATDNPFAAPAEAGKTEWTEADWNWMFAKVWMFGGFAGMLIGGSIMEARRDWPVYGMGGLLGSAGYGCFCMGAACWAKSKGRSAWFGLLGLLGWMAPLILALLAERKKSPASTVIADDCSVETPNVDVQKQIEASIGDWIVEDSEHRRVSSRSSNE